MTKENALVPANPDTALEVFTATNSGLDRAELMACVAQSAAREADITQKLCHLTCALPPARRPVPRRQVARHVLAEAAQAAGR